MIALVDADPICYRIAFACKEEPVKYAQYTIDRYIADILLAVDHDTRWYDKWQLFLSDSTANNFRNTIAVSYPYKGNRAEKPAHLQPLRDHLLNKWQATLAVGEEADDAIAIAASHNKQSIMVSIDKDFLQVPGWHYNFVKREHRYVKPKEGLRFFYTQLLTGDNTDNIIGLRGVGAKTADKLLGECNSDEEMFDVCVREYADADMPYERVVENAQLLWLRRTPNQLWQPPCPKEKYEY